LYRETHNAYEILYWEGKNRAVHSLPTAFIEISEESERSCHGLRSLSNVYELYRRTVSHNSALKTMTFDKYKIFTMNIKVTIILFVLTFASCDCVTKVNGKVLDKATGKPIDRVNVKLSSGTASTSTDELGLFDLAEVTGFCKETVIQVFTPGYLPFQLKIKKESNQTIYSVKSELYWKEFDKPYYPDSTNEKTFTTGIWFDRWSQDFAFKDSLIIYLTKDSLTLNQNK
jgi:hypothetical protein